jgi:hypothetical protein
MGCDGEHASATLQSLATTRGPISDERCAMAREFKSGAISRADAGRRFLGVDLPLLNGWSGKAYATDMSDDPILAALARLEAGQTTLRTDFLDELGRTRADLMDRMDRLQHRLDGLDERLTTGLGNSDRVERKADGVVEQNRLLAEQMTTMHKLLRKLEARIAALEERK